MFLYNKEDHSTYTDPELIIALVDLLYNEGYKDINIVEAQSTYGNYFTNREVTEVARYIGYEESDKYKVIDLSDKSIWVKPERPFTGPLKPRADIGETPVPNVWQDADFRISFAKNKTHNYCFYTLTIKCVYGALPIQNKYHEYHCNRGIYGSTIEYIEHYPIHFGFIDAYISADGPMGIYANKDPNYTRIIIGGENIIGVDWIGASKMKYKDTMKNQYMKLAIERFGKPEIEVSGNAGLELYKPWIRVGGASPYIMNNMFDKCYSISNIMTSSLFSVDKNEFSLRTDIKWYQRVLRFFTAPMRFFVFKGTKKIK